METTQVVKPKRTHVTRIVDALMDKGYRCTRTARINYAQTELQSGHKPSPTGEDFSEWYGPKGAFVVVAEEEEGTYRFFQELKTRTVGEDVVLL